MSPHNTLKSCGSSSRLDLRKNLPMQVIRGSSFNFSVIFHSSLAAGLFDKYWASASSGHRTIVRNLRQSNKPPFKPTRGWENITPGPIVIRTSAATMRIIGDSSTSKLPAIIISIARFSEAPGCSEHDEPSRTTDGRSAALLALWRNSDLIDLTSLPLLAGRSITRAIRPVSGCCVGL